MSEGFSFPTLPRPQPLEASLNPLLTRATVVDRSSSGSAAGLTDPDEMGAALSTAAPLSRHQRVAPAARRKRVPFEIGHSQMDWVQLTRSKGADLAGLHGSAPRRGITLDEVAQHKSRDDCWTILHGRVYNLTRYLPYHPGGASILLAVAGKDGTAVFNKYHAWVNADALLAKCLVGYLAPGQQQQAGSSPTSSSSGTASPSSMLTGSRAGASPGYAPASVASSDGEVEHEGEEEQQQQWSERQLTAA